ncbi:MAG: tRNA epoxyqueuosine(34) reductase QueG [Cellulosilyticaceae bacterium]
MLKNKIEVFCRSIGLDTVGFIPCRRFDELIPFYEQRQQNNLQNEFEEVCIEKRVDPRQMMPSGKTIISIAFPYDDGVEHIDNGFSIYTKRLDYHRVVKSYLDKICRYIGSLGGIAMGFVDSNALPERYIAYLAGIGFVGKNNMIITQKYGSYVFLGEIITDLEIVCEDTRSFEELFAYKECGTCENCITACPTKSINHVKINPNICLSYMTQKKELSDLEMRLLKGNVFGCDFCQQVCPYQLTRTKEVLEEFKSLDYMNDAVCMYGQMDNAFFKEKIAKTSCGWRGKNVIRRNAIIRMHREGEPIVGYKGESDYINDYIERLQKGSNR